MVATMKIFKLLNFLREIRGFILRTQALKAQEALLKANNPKHMAKAKEDQQAQPMEETKSPWIQTNHKE